MREQNPNAHSLFLCLCFVQEYTIRCLGLVWFIFFVTQFLSFITRYSKILCLFGTITHFSLFNIFHTIYGSHICHQVHFFFFLVPKLIELSEKRRRRNPEQTEQVKEEEKKEEEEETQENKESNSQPRRRKKKKKKKNQTTNPREERKKKVKRCG